jgi:predicted  nucleic acid-binding Zn-ribbon protein
VKYNRDQSKIAKKWWSKKKGKMKALEAKVEQQKQEISSLKEDLDATCASLEDALEEASQLHAAQEELELAKEKIRSLKSEVDELLQSQQEMKALLDVVEPMGGLKKIDNKQLCVAAISSLIVTFLGILKKNTHPTTCLCVVCKAVFENVLFGVEAT